MIASLQKLYREYSEYRGFSALDRQSKDIVFYVESARYWSYVGPVIEYLTQNLGRTVCYLTSSPDDPRLDGADKRIHGYYIGNGTVRTMLFAALDAGIMVMTIPEFGDAYLRRSPHPVRYVYLPHNLTSTHMVFPRHAFNYYDTIFCVGPHQVAELREAESIYGLDRRELVEAGYVRLDDLFSEAQSRPRPESNGSLQVIIAPSWGPSGLIVNGCHQLIENLLDAGYRVVLRPHWDSIEKDADTLSALRSRFDAHPGFRFFSDIPSDLGLYESHLMISDWSGAALSFAFAFERPVLFIDVPAKVNNPDFARFSAVPLESTIRNQIGQVLSPEEIHRAPQILESLHVGRDRYRDEIRRIRSRYVFRLGDNAAFIATKLAEMADRRP
jgi:YidC/Oxa1 family membrane protein insertase